MSGFGIVIQGKFIRSWNNTLFNALGIRTFPTSFDELSLALIRLAEL